VSPRTAAGTLTVNRISTPEAFADLAPDWDGLVLAMRRPSPFLLHGWLTEWWRHYGGGGELAVFAAHRDGRLVGALPFCLLPRWGLTLLTFVGDRESVLADLLVTDEGEGESVTTALTEHALEAGHDFVDLYGLPESNRLTPGLGHSRLHFIQRAEAPVLDLHDTWEAVYRARMSSKARSLHRRRRRQLAELGRVETAVARTEDELARALEDAFHLHDRRWDGRPDGSRFTTEAGKRFHRAAIRALAPLDVARITTLELDGRPIAFNYYFTFAGTMYGHRLAFDPALSRVSPGLINTLDSIALAAAEGATRIEFLGGPERYKVDLADRFEPMYEAVGLARTAPGAAAVRGRVAAIRARRFLKRSPALRRFYFEGLAPARRLLGRAGGRRRRPAAASRAAG
jgi:CelD/BcsL family acetyltransferase involved in cellulose biosynthesis